MIYQIAIIVNIYYVTKSYLLLLDIFYANNKITSALWLNMVGVIFLV